MPFTLSPEVRAWAARVGRHLPESAARRLRPLYHRVVGGPDDSAPVALAAPPALLVPPRRPLGDEPELVVLPPPRENLLQVWPRRPPVAYLGQLEPEFQSEMARMWEGVELEDCLFYHRVRLRDGRVIDGPWNLLGGEHEYLGHVELEGRRVLELGPATGWLTVWMELEGASVVGFDQGWDAWQDLMPLPGLDVDAVQPDFVRRACRSQNSWWYLRRDYGLTSRAVYGSIYQLPEDIGRYDLSVFGAILLHLRDPFRALEQAARHTEEAIVVVEPLPMDLVGLGSAARWNPTGGNNPTGWWHHSPAAVVDMLAVLGFPEAAVTYHQQPYRDEDVGGPWVDAAFFTVVARRG